MFFSSFFYLNPDPHVLLLFSDSSGADVIVFLIIDMSVNDTMLYLCLLKKDARGGQGLTQSLANEKNVRIVGQVTLGWEKRV